MRGHKRGQAPALIFRSSRIVRYRVFVTLKPGVLDPQGKAIHHALEGLGFAGLRDVRAGKLIELDLEDRAAGEDEIEAMCRKLLANTVIENFRIERLEPAKA
jgi:phosphoribosylformylglycinamidine synthase